MTVKNTAVPAGIVVATRLRAGPTPVQPDHGPDQHGRRLSTRASGGPSRPNRTSARPPHPADVRLRGFGVQARSAPVGTLLQIDRTATRGTHTEWRGLPVREIAAAPSGLLRSH
jgi:hypothetical protein